MGLVNVHTVRVANTNHTFFAKKALNGWNLWALIALANQSAPVKAVAQERHLLPVGTVWTTDWYELYYYDDRQLIDYIDYWAGLLAYGLRMVAWNKVRWARGRRERENQGSGPARGHVER